LISWWRGEGTGLDSWGNNHGTVMGGGIFTTAMVGRGFYFNGSGDDWIALPPDMFPMPTSGTGNTPFSFEVWFSTTASGVILGQQDQAPFDTALGGNVAALYVGTNGLLYAEMFWGADNPLVSTNVVANGVFHHVVVTYDGTTEILYLDGAPIGSTAFSQVAYATNYFYQIGTGWSDDWPATPQGWFPFNGTIDEPSYYGRALSASEVLALYQSGSAGKCAPFTGPALAHRYNFNEPAGSMMATDSISRSHGLLLFATTTAPYTNGTPDGSGFTGNGKLVLNGTSGYVSFPPRMISWLSNATFEAWVSWNGPVDSDWQRVWDFGFNDKGTNASGFGTNYIIFSPSRGGTRLMGFEETIANPFGDQPDPNAVILYGNNQMPIGQEIYIALTYDPLNGSSKLYLNGNLVSSTNRTLNAMKNFTDYNNWLGRSQWERDPFYNGAYDEFRIWDGVLSAQDIANHYAAGPNEQFTLIRPTLFITRAANQMVISWYTNQAEGFQLESTVSLKTPNWQPVTNAPIYTNGANQVKVSATGAAGYYRLKQ